MGFDLIQVVVMKAPMDLFDQFRCSAEVDLSGMDIHMAHIGCQPRKPRVHVLPVPIPGQKPMNREGVPDVVQPGTVFVVMDMALSQQLPEGLIDSTVVQAAGSLIDKERRIGRAWQHLQALMLVLLQCLAGGITQGHPACLSEFAFCDIQ